MKRAFVASLLAGWLLALSSPQVLAGPPPVEVFFKSAVGKYFLTESMLGKELGRVLGVTTTQAERVAVLLAAGENLATRQALESRIVRISERLERTFGDRAKELMSRETGTALANLNLSKGEMKQIIRILEEELNSEVIATLPRLRQPTAASPRANFLGNVASPAVNGRRFAGVFERLSPNAAAALPQQWALRTLADEEMSYRQKNLAQVLKSLNGIERQITIGDLKTAFRSMLEGKVPSYQIEGRIQGLFSGNGSSESLNRALGDLTLTEVGELVHGGSPLKPKADSLLGRYLEETGAATLVRRFPVGPDSSELGPMRLVVALSERSFRAYAKYFTGQNFLTHVHTPDQGTLHIAFEGQYGSYGSLTRTMRTPQEGTLMPSILLKSTEGSRASLYFDVSRSIGGGDPMLEPWTLEGYCAMGGYNSCTHWIGNIPLGDKLVSAYRFPGKVDAHAYNQVSPGVQVKPLQQYPLDPASSNLTAEQITRLRRVWKVPGNEQLADAVGLGPQNVKGELANPGYVAFSLVGRASTERVPFVFVVVPDHRAPIRRGFDLQISAY